MPWREFLFKMLSYLLMRLNDTAANSFLFIACCEPDLLYYGVCYPDPYYIPLPSAAILMLGHATMAM